VKRDSRDARALKPEPRDPNPTEKDSVLDREALGAGAGRAPDHGVGVGVGTSLTWAPAVARAGVEGGFAPQRERSARWLMAAGNKKVRQVRGSRGAGGRKREKGRGVCVCKGLLVWWVGDGVGFEQCRTRCWCVRPPKVGGLLRGAVCKSQEDRVILGY